MSRLDETTNARAAQQVEQNSPELVVLVTMLQMLVIDGWVDENIYQGVVNITILYKHIFVYYICMKKRNQ